MNNDLIERVSLGDAALDLTRHLRYICISKLFNRLCCNSDIVDTIFHWVDSCRI